MNAKKIKRFPKHGKLMLNTNLALRSVSPYGQMTCLLLLSIVVWEVEGSSFFPHPASSYKSGLVWSEADF